MFKVLVKILFACFVGMSWYNLNGPEQAPVAVILFVMVLVISFIKPIKFQDPNQREDYRHKIQSAREQKIALEKKHAEEKVLIRQQAKDSEELRKKELKDKLKL